MSLCQKLPQAAQRTRTAPSSWPTVWTLGQKQTFMAASATWYMPKGWPCQSSESSVTGWSFSHTSLEIPEPEVASYTHILNKLNLCLVYKIKALVLNSILVWLKTLFFNMGPYMGTLHLGCSTPPPSFCSTKCLILCYTIVPMIFKTNKQTKTLERNANLWYLSGPSNPKSVGEITNASQTTT